MASPPVRREKTYTAASGYVYQYYFVGQREALPGSAAAVGLHAGDAATEFIFDATRDRHATFAFSVFLSRAALDEWRQAHGRALAPNEIYAAAKLRLLQGFDELGAADLHSSPRRFTLDAAGLEETARQLNLS